jgi:ribosomal protein L37E
MAEDTGWKCKHCGHFNTRTNICAKCGYQYGSTVMQEENMSQWKYIFVTCNHNEGRANWVARYINGQELPDWTTAPTMYEVSNQLGGKGWELVGFATSEHAIRLVFKREK